MPDGELWFYLSTAGAHDTNAADYALTPDANGQASVSAPADFLADLQADLNATVTNDTARLVIFIHGLANSFASGIADTGTLGAGLAGGVSLDVSVVCHSEGNYMLMQGLNYLNGNRPSRWQNINNVIMLAADINDAALQVPGGQNVGTGAAISQLSGQVTIYYSVADPELAISTVLYVEYHNPDYRERLGMVGPYSFDAGALEANTYGVDCSWVVNPANIARLKFEEILPWYVLEHSSYIYIPQILEDMTQTLDGTAPGAVVNRQSLGAPDGQAYKMEVDDSSSADFQEQVRAKNATILPHPSHPC